jgi:RNA polymerase sigma factor (sigma-70 family)
MRPTTCDERILEPGRSDDSSGLSQVGLLGDLQESEKSDSEVHGTSGINPEDHLNLARKIAHKYVKHEDYEELIGVAFLALVRASQKFKPELGNAFSTYTYRSITNSILKHLIKKRKRIGTVQLDGDIVDQKDAGNIELPSSMSTNEEHICRLLSMGYKHEEIRTRLSLSESKYSKHLATIRRKILEQQKA